MNKAKIILLLAPIIIFIISTSCEDTSSPPKQNKSVRDYTWTIDTLNIQDAYQNKMSSMYASSIDDIYLVGHNSGSPINNGNGNMWHYDGNKWEIVKLREQIGAFGTLNSIHGSSLSNIWAVGGAFEYSAILQYDGVNWKKHLAETSDGIFGTPISKHEIYSVYAESETNVWACGDGGIVYHYDGNIWDVDTIKMSLKDDEKFIAKDVINYNSELFLIGIKSTIGNFYGTYYFIKKHEKKWEVIDSLVQNVQGGTVWKWGIKNLYKSESNKLYSYGSGGVFENTGNNWVNIFESNASIQAIYEYNSEKMIAVSQLGEVFLHENSTWNSLDSLFDDNIWYTGVYVTEKEVFIVGFTFSFPMQTIVLHGK